MSETRNVIRFQGIWLGNALALGISWAVHHSILWALLHCLLGWTYVAYWAVRRFAL